jgi:hypothetical protein
VTTRVAPEQYPVVCATPGLAPQPRSAPDRRLADLEQRRRLLVRHPGAVECSHDPLPGEIKEFIDFCLSKGGQQIVTLVGHFPVK